MLRDGINRRQVPQLKKALEAGTPIMTISGNFKVLPEVILAFAKDWGIKVKETPETLELEKHSATIEAEVAKRVRARLAKMGEPEEEEKEKPKIFSKDK